MYALAATLFKLLTGNTPPEAIEIIDDGFPVAELQEKQISRPVIYAIAMAMKGRHERTQSVTEFVSNLSRGCIEESEWTEVFSALTESEEKAKVNRKRKRLWTVAVVVAIVVILLMIFLQ